MKFSLLVATVVLSHGLLFALSPEFADMVVTNYVPSNAAGDAPEGDVAAYHEALAILSSPNPQPTTRNSQPDLVLLANAVRAAAERLGAAVGATYSSDMLDNLFSRFCVGK